MALGIVSALGVFLKFGLPTLGLSVPTVVSPIAAICVIVGVVLCVNYYLSNCQKPPKAIDAGKKQKQENSLQESIENVRNQSQLRDSELKKTVSNERENYNKTE